MFITVGAFLGLLLLAIALIAGGVTLLVGIDHVKALFRNKSSSVSPRAGAPNADATAATVTSDGTPKVSKAHMRPYKVAKAQGVPSDDRLYGLLLVIAGLAMLWLVPAYLFKSKTSDTYQPPVPVETPPYTRKYSLSESTPGQAVLGVFTLVILLATFAMLGPEKQTKKAAETLKHK
jgi:hypothetical protein